MVWQLSLSIGCGETERGDLLYIHDDGNLVTFLDTFNPRILPTGRDIVAYPCRLCRLLLEHRPVTIQPAQIIKRNDCTK